MKAAILADIHGNSLALRNVIADIQALGGVDETWLLGDYAAIGPDPVGVLELIVSLPNARFIRGNTDRYLGTGESPWPGLPDVNRQPALAEMFIHVTRSFAWSSGAVAATGWLPWLEALPLNLHRMLPDGKRVLGVHAAPDTDDGMGISINTPDEELLALVRGVEADLLLVGHTHIPFDRQAGIIRVINPGSISNPFPPDLRASYVLLEADKAGYAVEFRRVDYDHQAVIEATQAVKHPACAYITAFMRGEVRKDWMKPEES